MALMRTPVSMTTAITALRPACTACLHALDVILRLRAVVATRERSLELFEFIRQFGRFPIRRRASRTTSLASW